MQTIRVKIAAVLVLCAYLTGVAGLDLHSCRASGRSYVILALSGIDGLYCNHIHPGSCDSCNSCASCNDAGHEKEPDESGHKTGHGRHDMKQGQDCSHSHDSQHQGIQDTENGCSCCGCCSDTFYSLKIAGTDGNHRSPLVYFPPVHALHDCCLCCADCRACSTNRIAGLGLLDGHPLVSTTGTDILFSVFRI